MTSLFQRYRCLEILKQWKRCFIFFFFAYQRNNALLIIIFKILTHPILPNGSQFPFPYLRQLLTRELLNCKGPQWLHNLLPSFAALLMTAGYRICCTFPKGEEILSSQLAEQSAGFKQAQAVQDRIQALRRESRICSFCIILVTWGKTLTSHTWNSHLYNRITVPPLWVAVRTAWHDI